MTFIDQNDAPTVDEVLHMITTMALIREFEEVAAQSLFSGEVRGSVHQYSGQEAIAAGVCYYLNQSDFVSSNHRGHGHAIAKGVSCEKMMCELFGKSAGTSGGKGGSMHIADFSCGMLGANGVVPDGVTIAVGAAHAIKMQRRGEIVVAFFGDGALNRGPLFEAFNWATLFKLPVLFVCEDNSYSVTLQTKTVTGGPDPIERVRSFGIPSHEVNGNNVVEVSAVSKKLIDLIRKGSGPQFLRAKTYRWFGHLAHDKGLYRDSAEVENALKDDPINNASSWLKSKNVNIERVQNCIQNARNVIFDSLTMARQSPFPLESSAFEDIQDANQEVDLEL